MDRCRPKNSSSPMAHSAMQRSPITAACEKSIVAYGNGAEPRNTASVVRNAYGYGTNLDKKRNIATPPSAVIRPTEQAVVAQSETSQPVGESSGISNRRRTPADAANAGDARNTIPGPLSL